MSVRSVTRCKKTKLSCLLLEMGSKESTTVNGPQRYKESSWSVSPDGFDIVILFYARNTAAKARDTSQHPTTQVEQLSNKRHISVQEM